MLCNSREFEIILPVYALWRENLEKLRELLPFGELRPAVYWIGKSTKE
jgi:hypothetical protein